jgi:hypothetical protein
VLVLADWSTAIAAIAGSAIGALAGVVAAFLTLRGAAINIGYQEREAWRVRQIEATQGFAYRYTDALTVMTAVALTRTDPDGKGLEKVDAAHSEFIQVGTLVALLFGTESTTGNAASRMQDRLGEMVQRTRALVESDGEGWEKTYREIREKASAADVAYFELMRAVHDQIAPRASSVSG